MDEGIRAHLDALHSSDRAVQGQAFESLMAATSGPVAWAYEAWDELLGLLRDGDNRQRSIAAQVLCNFSASDPEGRMLTDLDALFETTRDKRFVTARHALLALWKVGLAGEPQRRQVVDRMARRFQECGAEKNSTLVRFDIAQGLRRLYDAVGDESIRAKALALIETEPDARYRRKYAGVWKST